MLFPFSLTINCPHRKITSITHYFKRKIPIRGLNDWSRDECIFEYRKSFHAVIIEIKACILSKQVRKGPSNLGKIFNKATIKTSMPQKTKNTLDIHRRRKLFFTSIFALSTSMPRSDTKCLGTMPSRTIKWHFSQLSTRSLSWQRYKTLSKFSKQ